MESKHETDQGEFFNRETLTEEVLKEWQNLLDQTAEMIGVPAGLITRVDGDEIEILLSSETRGNPYPVPCTSPFPNSGWYCEHTLRSRALNLIPNALDDPKWKDNDAAVQLSMVSYLGMPIETPNGDLFGTICFIDNKQNEHNKIHVLLVKQIKRMVELSLSIILAHNEIKTLKGIVPICSACKKIRDDKGYWNQLEAYIEEHSAASFSHSVCPECSEKLYGREDWYSELKKREKSNRPSAGAPFSSDRPLFLPGTCLCAKSGQKSDHPSG